MYDFSTLLQFLIGGISVGCIYGLVGIGFSVLYNSSGIINFAQGGFVMLGGMLTYILYSLVGVPLPAGDACRHRAGELPWPRHRMGGDPAAACAQCVSVRHDPGDARLPILIENATLHLVDDKPHSIPYFTPGPPLQFLGAALGLQIIWIIGVSLFLVFLLGLLSTVARSFGRAMRACAINPEVARILGIKVERMVAAGFILSAALGAIGEHPNHADPVYGLSYRCAVRGLRIYRSDHRGARQSAPVLSLAASVSVCCSRSALCSSMPATRTSSRLASCCYYCSCGRRGCSNRLWSRVFGWAKA